MFKLKKNKGEKGITLIALIVTIIILIILAGITIGTLTGDNGIIQQAQTAKTETERSDIEEKINVIVIDNSKEKEMNKDKLINDFENKLPDGKEIVDSDNLIYIIYPEYSFEVDIDSGEVKETEIDRVEDDTPWELAGKGTEEDPYLIESIEDLVAFSNSVNSGNTYNGNYIKLTTNLDFNLPFSYDNPKTKVLEKTNRIIEEDSNGTELKTFLTSGTGFNPIGNENKYFRGNFDGNGKEIKNIYINRPEENYVALFGYSQGTIEKLGVTGNIVGNNYVSGISAGNGMKTIKYCYNKAYINGKNDVAGIAAIGNNGELKYCYNLGEITGSSDVSGISGALEAMNSYNYGKIEVTGNSWAGGINTWNKVENCYNLGDILSKNSAGGIMGSTSADIRNSYNKGQVKGGSTSAIGGIIGNYHSSQGMLVDNYYLKGTAIGGANGEDIEGAMPLEESEMPSVISVLMTDGEKVEWNGEMVDIWKEDTENINNGYPILFWQ